MHLGACVSSCPDFMRADATRTCVCQDLTYRLAGSSGCLPCDAQCFQSCTGAGPTRFVIGSFVRQDFFLSFFFLFFFSRASVFECIGQVCSATVASSAPIACHPLELIAFPQMHTMRVGSLWSDMRGRVPQRLSAEHESRVRTVRSPMLFRMPRARQPFCLCRLQELP
jgi:hypothetical protein